jgi:hypothetical protein
LIYQHFSSFAEPQSMYQEYKQGLQPLRLRLKIMLDTSKILLLKSKFNSSIRKIEITYYNASVRAFYLQHIHNNTAITFPFSDFSYLNVSISLVLSSHRSRKYKDIEGAQFRCQAQRRSNQTIVQRSP